MKNIRKEGHSVTYANGSQTAGVPKTTSRCGDRSHYFSDIHVDPTLVEPALGQILDDAAKYSPAGSTIEVSASEHDDAVVTAVRDQGAGLMDEEQSRMWERYFRGSRHLAAVTGSGLGTWIALAFISADNGTIEVTSAGPGLGTTVSISWRLPALLRPT